MNESTETGFYSDWGPYGMIVLVVFVVGLIIFGISRMNKRKP